MLLFTGAYYNVHEDRDHMQTLQPAMNDSYACQVVRPTKQLWPVIVCEAFTSTEPRSSWDGHGCGGKKVASVPRPVSLALGLEAAGKFLRGATP
jgi:hypothetical protein